MTSLRSLLPRRKPREHSRAGHRRRIVLALALLLVVAGGVGAWLLWRGDQTAAAAPTTATVTTETVKQTVAASGTVAAASTADLGFDVSGTVKDVRVEEGDQVKAGAIIATLDATSLEAARSAAASALTAARAQLDEAVERDADDVQIAAAQSGVVAAEAALEQAGAAVDGAVLRSTIGGTITDVGIHVGDVVAGRGSAVPATSTGTSTGTTTGTTTGTGAESGVVTVMSSQQFVVEATVSSADVEQLRRGQQAEITVTGIQDTVYGTVESIGLVAGASSSGGAVFPVTIEVTGKRDDLYAGTSADASIIVKQTEGVLTVTSRALRTEDGKTYADKVVDGEAVRTEVEVGQVYGMSTEVLGGLAEGDVVELPAVERPGGGNGGGGDRPQFGPGGGGFPGGGQMPPGGFGRGGGAP